MMDDRERDDEDAGDGCNAAAAAVFYCNITPSKAGRLLSSYKSLDTGESFEKNLPCQPRLYDIFVRVIPTHPCGSGLHPIKSEKRST